MSVSWVFPVPPLTMDGVTSVPPLAIAATHAIWIGVTWKPYWPMTVWYVSPTRQMSVGKYFFFQATLGMTPADLVRQIDARLLPTPNMRAYFSILAMPRPFWSPYPPPIW